MTTPAKGILYVLGPAAYNFVRAHNTADPFTNNRKTPNCLRGRLVTGNDARLVSHCREGTGCKIDRWEGFLITYGFLLIEFEQWCEERDIQPYKKGHH